MKSATSYQADSIDDRIEAMMAKVRALRPLQITEQARDLPIQFDPTAHQPIDPMAFAPKKWSKTPWDGVRCLAISLDPKEVMVICQVDKPIKMQQHEHGPWSEELIMLEGVLHEHSTDEKFLPGIGVYFQPAGHIHEPEFKTPSRCVITWRRD